MDDITKSHHATQMDNRFQSPQPQYPCSKINLRTMELPPGSHARQCVYKREDNTLPRRFSPRHNAIVECSPKPQLPYVPVVPLEP